MSTCGWRRMTDFTHLHVASALSAHYGTATPEELIAAAAADGATALGLTDQAALYGAVRFIRSARSVGINPIVGAELPLAPLVTRRVNENEPPQSARITVLAHGSTGGAGWASVARLISVAHGSGRRANGGRTGPRLSPQRLASFTVDHRGQPQATVLLGPDSDVGQALLRRDYPQARSRLAHWRELLNTGVALEVVCHHTRPGTARSLSHAVALLDCALAAGVPAILSNEVRYCQPRDAMTGDVLDAARELRPLGDFTAQPNAQAWLKPAAEMVRLAEHIASNSEFGAAGARVMLNETASLADRCVLDADNDLAWRQPKTPELPQGVDQSPARILLRRCLDGVQKHYPTAKYNMRKQISDRLSAELITIEDFGFESYFLTVADVVDLIREKGIRAQARGSGAGSLVNYLIGIGSVDPIAHNLLFERFLGAGRATLPDIDIDVESARRPEIYRDIVQRYGEHCVALLSMHNAYRTRSAVRDAGLALGVAPDIIDRLAKSVWRIGARDLRAALSINPELQEVAQLVGSDRQLDLLIDMVSSLDRLPRHISMHPCGVIIGNNDLLSLTPVQPSGMGLPMSQFDKDDIDDLGLLKLDILGVRMQSTLAYTVAEVERTSGVDIDLSAIPRDDLATFEMIRSTNTLGVFQLESPGQRELIGRLQPDHYTDLIADISLFRPGPMQANMIQPFIAAKRGQRRLELHPRFTEFLADSYGVVIYHEHVLRILADCMDISLAEADQLRRRLARESAEIGEAFRIAAAKRYAEDGQRLFSDSQIAEIWSTLESFGAFGFCKAHAASFAVPTYQSAWLKTHYPAEFFAGILEHDPGMYPRRLLVAEARRLGVPIVGLDINADTASYQVVQTAGGVKGIRLALKDVHGMSQAQLGRILAGQPYESVFDFYERAVPSRPLFQRLASVGAFDVFGERRGDILAQVRQLTGQIRRPLCQGQLPLPMQLNRNSAIEAVEPTALERVQAEVAVLGTEITQHAITAYQPLLAELEVTSAAELLALPDGTSVRVAGVRVATQTPPTRSGQRVVFISLDDGTGTVECTFFSDAQERSGPVLFGPKILAVSGRTRRTGERGITVSAESAADLKVLWANRKSAGRAT